MEIYGLLITHIWLASCVVLYVGYLTYADYYDKIINNFSYDLIQEFMYGSLVIFSMCLILFLSAVTDVSNKDINISEFYIGICNFCSIFLSIGYVILFMRNSSNIRRYFGRKRNKI